MALLIECWTALLVVVLALMFYRRWLARNEDDNIHLSQPDGGIIRQQVQLEKKLDRLDFTGKSLTILLALYTLVLAGRFVYQGWLESMRMH